MDDRPKRRWLQFRLSTWFVLVAILVWAIVDPIYTKRVEMGTHPFTGNHVEVIRQRINFRPILGLLAFLAWKAFWAVVERRREKHPTHAYDTSPPRALDGATPLARQSWFTSVHERGSPAP